MLRQSKWTVKQAVLRGRQTLRQHGPVALWFKVLGEICYRRAYVVARTVVDVEIPDTSVHSYEIILLNEADVVDYSRLRPEADPAEIRQRLRDGMLCLFGRYEGGAVFAVWFTDRRIRVDYLGLEVEMKPDAAYGFELWVHPEFRRRGLVKAARRKCRSVLRERGYKRIAAVVMPENRPGLLYHLRAGYRIVGRLHVLRFLGLRRAWISGAERDLPLALPADQ